MERPALPATHDERGAVSSCISRALSSLCGLRAHFTFLPCKQKHFTFARLAYLMCLLMMIIMPDRRKSDFKAYQVCSVTLPPRAPSRHARRARSCIVFLSLLLCFIAFYLMCPQHRHARRARSCIVVHFTCPLVALRFEGTFHVFALQAKTFHFCAEVMLAYRSHISAQKFHVRSGGGSVWNVVIPPPRRTPQTPRL